MADIVLTCPDCGKQTPISEYVSGNTTACHACGKTIPVPERPRSLSNGLKLRPPADESPMTPTPTWPSTGAGIGIPVAAVGQQPQASAALKRDIRRVKVNRMMPLLSWLVFIALAAALYFIRFRSGLPGMPLETLKLDGLIAIGIAYLVIIMLALKDNMFDGLLSIVVPLYPFYYLFFMSNALFLRAIVAGLLVGFGYDFVLFLQVVWLSVFNGVNYWIQHV